MTNEEMMRRIKTAQAEPSSYDTYISPNPEQARAQQPSSTYSSLIAAHFEEHFPNAETFAFVEGSDDLHIDVCVLEPTKKNPYYVLYTCGMSDYAMHVPPRFSEMKRAELYMLLPPEWDFRDVKGEIPYQSFWPVKLLRALGRFPHESRTWLGRGHSIANGDDMLPFVRDSEMCAAVLSEPAKSFSPLAIKEDFAIRFYLAIPIYREELDFKERYGANELYKLFTQSRISLVTDVHRDNVALPYIRS
jgi:hypothetical protein